MGETLNLEKSGDNTPDNNRSTREATDRDGWTSASVLSIVFIVLLTEQAAFAFQIVTVALPDISATFATTQISWVMVLTGLLGGLASPLVGKLADIHGKKKVLVSATVVGIIGSLLAALAPVYWMLLLGRALQGATFVAVGLSFSLVRDIFPPKIMPLAASLTVTGVGAITILQPFLSGALVDAFGFRGVFWFLVVYSTICVLGVITFSAESPVRARMRIDWFGAALLGAGIGALMLGLSMGSTWGWTSSRTIGCLIAAILLVVAWVEVDRRIDEPLVDLRMLRSRPVATTILSGGLFYGGAGVIATVIPLMVMTPREIDGTVGFGTTALGTAVYFLPLGIGTVAVGFLVGAGIRRIGARTPAIVGAALAVLGALSLAIWHDAAPEVLFGIALIGVGQGFFYAAIPNLLIGCAPVEQQAVTASMMTSFQALMPTIITQIVFIVLTQNLSGSGAIGVTYTGIGYSYAFAITGGVFCLAVLITLAVPHSRTGSIFAEDPVVAVRAGEPAPTTVDD